MALDNPVMDSQKELEWWIGMRGKKRTVNSLLSTFQSHSPSLSYSLNTLLTNSLLSFFLSLTINIKIKFINASGVTHFPGCSQEWSLWVSGLLFSKLFISAREQENKLREANFMPSSDTVSY